MSRVILEGGKVIVEYEAEWFYAYECMFLGCDGQWLMLEDIQVGEVFCPKCGSTNRINKPGRKLVTVHKIE